VPNDKQIEAMLLKIHEAGLLTAREVNQAKPIVRKFFDEQPEPFVVEDRETVPSG